jgi:hypothetical protein
MKLSKIFYLSMVAVAIFSCNPNDEPDTPDTPIVPEASEMAGLYVLSEGTWGGNNASLSYFEYESGSFTNDFFELKNPSKGGLGDVSNDIKIYGSKLYAVINSSNYVEVMDAKTAKHIGTIQIANCRSITFEGGFAYITSFAGAIMGVTQQLGFVAKADTANLQIVSTLDVDYQPEELTVANGKLYVANSGGYNYPNYSDKVSVIDLNLFKFIKNISVGKSNLSKIRTDKNGKVWVISTGNYRDISPSVSVINPVTDEVTNTLNLNSISDFDFYGDSLYFCGAVYNMDTYENIVCYGIIDINSKRQVAANFITDGTESQIIIPYALKINRFNGDIFLSDALDCLSPGKVYCLDKEGKFKWLKTAGVCPGHFAFLTK